MKKALADFKSQVCDIHPPSELSDQQWKEFSENCVVALMAGGESSRFKSVPGSDKTNKNSFKLPNGDTMIEMTIRMYRDAGIKNFVALVYHKAETIENLLGDGTSLGVNIKYSYDPEHPVGKGGAVLNALVNGSIPQDKILIVHNPDDVILGFDKQFPRHIAAGYNDGVKNGAKSTIVVVEETPYAFTGMKVTNNIVQQIEMYPMIPIPTHIGVSIFSPESYPYFHENFDLTKKSDFEQVLFPILADKKELSTVSIPSDAWLAVNTLKAYNELIKHLNTPTTP